MKHRFLLVALGWVLGVMSSAALNAQSFTNLHSFAGSPGEGGYPFSALLVIGEKLYGTTSEGGAWNNGTVFTMNRDGTGFTNLHSFSAGAYNSWWRYTNSEGKVPHGGLVLVGDTLYGTTSYGGIWGSGTIYAIHTNGSGFTNLHTFSEAAYYYPRPNAEGAGPDATLIAAGDSLYGTATFGGHFGYGTVFALKTDGSSFTNLHQFTSGSDGGYPQAGLVLSGDTLYGAASSGGQNSRGTLFAVKTNGTGFTNFYSFTDDPWPSNTNSDGVYPYGTLVLSDGMLYGTTGNGGLSSRGTVFAVRTNGADFQTLHSFSAFTRYSNPDGGEPQSGLVLLNGTLYGTAYGGPFGAGTVFAVNTDGTGFTNLHHFNYGDGEGWEPYGGLAVSGNDLFGMSLGGGSFDIGTVFRISLPAPVPNLAFWSSGAEVILTWPTHFADFKLQSTTDLVPPVSWSNHLPAAVVVNGQNTVTNPISGPQRFFRLSQ